MPSFTVHLDTKTVTVAAATADNALEDVATSYGVPADELAVYLDNPTPHVDAKYGAPMGRMGNGPIDPDGRIVATPVDLDEGGYDDGGAYWGLRPAGQSLYCVQDGWGHFAFADAASAQDAIESYT